MPDTNFNNLNEFLNSPFGQAAVGAVGALPLPVMAGAPGGPPLNVDAHAVGAQVIGMNVDFKDRAGLLRALTAAFPITKDASGKEVVTQSAASQHSLSLLDLHDTPLVGPAATIQVAAQTVLQHADSLSTIEPLGPCPPGFRGHKKLVGMIRDVIGQVARKLSRQDPVGVDVLFKALCGYDPDRGTYVDISTVGGYLGDLRDRCGLELKNATTDEAEQILTRFATMVALVGMLVHAWHAEKQSSSSGDYLGTSSRELRRYFAGIVAGLAELRQLIPRTDWATTTLPTRDPINAGDAWQWMHEVASVQAWQMLQQGGRESLRLIALAMRKFLDILDEGFSGKGAVRKSSLAGRPAKAKPVCDDGKTDIGDVFDGMPDYCDGVAPRAFNRRKVQNVVRQLQCHAQRVLEVIYDVVDEPSRVLHAKFYSSAGEPLDAVPCDGIVWARVCGDVPADAVVQLVGGDEPAEPDEILRDKEGITGKFVLGGAKQGWRRAALKFGNGRHTTLPDGLFVYDAAKH